MSFNSGAFESPFISSIGSSGPHSPESTQSDASISTYEFGEDGRMVGSIIVTVNRLVLITSLEMRYTDGEVAFSHCFDPDANGSGGDGSTIFN